ncbi:hypothetical protein G6F35_014213 [Rhizopus arrhizus]|nr:hypothetical protein G6F35_014213 [Rhizopus arrhizus]
MRCVQRVLRACHPAHGRRGAGAGRDHHAVASVEPGGRGRGRGNAGAVRLPDLARGGVHPGLPVRAPHALSGIRALVCREFAARLSARLKRSGRLGRGRGLGEEQVGDGLAVHGLAVDGARQQFGAQQLHRKHHVGLHAADLLQMLAGVDQRHRLGAAVTGGFLGCQHDERVLGVVGAQRQHIARTGHARGVQDFHA